MNALYVKDANFHAYLNFRRSGKVKEISLKSLEMDEEDLRMKSAKFSTSYKIDTTQQQVWVYVAYKGQPVYSGIILTNEYDEQSGYYTYTTIGHQRWLTSKTWFVANPTNKEDSLYDSLKAFCKRIKQETSINGVILKPQKQYKAYKNTKNNWKLEDGLFYEDKTYYEILMSLVAKSNCAIDTYVDENNILHNDVIDIDHWQRNNSVKLTTAKLTDYEIKSDSTNIITQVYVKNSDIFTNHKVTEPSLERSKDLIGVNLSLYYGKMSSFANTMDNKYTVNTSNDDKEAVTDVEANEALARNKITSSMRDLMSFKITFDGYIPYIHTNMFIWFEVPPKHTLANYSQFVAKINKTTTRGGAYVLNRFYVEGLKITYDDKGISTEVTLNPFASDLSSYSNLYDEAQSSYEQANCKNSNNNSLNANSGSSDATTTQTITVTGKPSTGQAAKYYKYKNYTKTWKNYCPFCKKTGTLSDNPKGVPEHEITCDKKKGGCDADFDVTTGGDKNGNYRKYLVDVNGKSNTKTKVDITIGDSSGTGTDSSGGLTSTDTGTSGNCTSSGTSASGSYTTEANVQALANKLSTATDQLKIAKDMQQMKNKGAIGYHCHSGFCWTPTQVVAKGQANCCDGTRLQHTMSAFKGVNQSDLIFCHGHGHVWGKYKDIWCDWLGGGKWNGRPWGGYSLSKTSVFPNTPFQGACINPYYSCGADEDIPESVGWAKTFNDKLTEAQLKEAKDWAADNIENQPDYEELTFDDFEYYVDKYGLDSDLHGLNKF